MYFEIDMLPFRSFGEVGKKKDIFTDCDLDRDFVDFILFMSNLQVQVNHISIFLSTFLAVLTFQDGGKFECCAQNSTSSGISSLQHFWTNPLVQSSQCQSVMSTDACLW